MLAPKPFFSLIGKYVFHSEILTISGAAAWAWAVVSAGWRDRQCRHELGRLGATGPLGRASAWTRATVAATSTLVAVLARDDARDRPLIVRTRR